MTQNITRADPRYVAIDDGCAVLEAWTGPDLTMQMGGWTDDDAEAFEAAVRDSLVRDADMSVEDAAQAQVTISRSDVVQKLVDDAIEGIIDNDISNGLSNDLSGWDADDAVRLTAGLEGPEEDIKFRPSEAQIAKAAECVAEFLMRAQAAITSGSEAEVRAVDKEFCGACRSGCRLSDAVMHAKDDYYRNGYAESAARV